jgi:sugar phosphate isomerase/epimerase
VLPVARRDGVHPSERRLEQVPGRVEAGRAQDLAAGRVDHRAQLAEALRELADERREHVRGVALGIEDEGHRRPPRPELT